MPHRIIQNEADLVDLGRFLVNLQFPFTVEWVQGRDRSRDQNALQWLWATEAAHQFGDRTPAEVQADWKLRHGVPILREDSADFRAFYDQSLKMLTYEQKLKAMDYVPVTSLMKVRQMVRFLDTIQRESLQQGVRLTDPNPELASYQRRYRARPQAIAA